MDILEAAQSTAGNVRYDSGSIESVAVSYIALSIE